MKEDLKIIVDAFCRLEIIIKDTIKRIDLLEDTINSQDKNTTKHNAKVEKVKDNLH